MGGDPKPNVEVAGCSVGCVDPSGDEQEEGTAVVAEWLWAPPPVLHPRLVTIVISTVFKCR